MKLLVGLGNMGAQYSKTRHNLGFMVIDQLIQKRELPPCTLNDKFQAEIVEGRVGEEKLLLAKPTTMMNLSGEAIGKLARFYKIDPFDVWVIHDDLDLAFGKLRVRQGGGSAGHNGLKSIIDAIGENFGRFRIGIQNDQLKNPIAPDAFVLSQFDETELANVPKIIENTAQIVLDRLHSSSLEDTSYNLII